MNKLFLIFSFTVSIHLHSGPKKTIIPPSGMSFKQTVERIQEKKAQHKLEFAFDLHKVILQKNTKSILQTIFVHPHKWQLFTVLINPRLLLGMKRMACQAMINTMPWASRKYKELTAEELIWLVKAHGNEQLMALAMEIINTQEVDPEVEKIIIELKRLGYPLRIASNIGKEIYKKLRKQLQDSHSNIFAYFDKDAQGMEGKTIDYRVSRVQKPDPEFFQEFLDAYNPDGSKLIIFIDDKRINVKAAKRLGFVGIHFKNAEQLLKDLHILGIF